MNPVRLLKVVVDLLFEVKVDDFPCGLFPIFALELLFELAHPASFFPECFLNKKQMGVEGSFLLGHILLDDLLLLQKSQLDHLNDLLLCF